MNAKKCDRCGIYYDKNKNAFSSNSKPLSKVITWNEAESTNNKSYDLCDDCMKLFLYDFMLLEKVPSNPLRK